MSLLALCPGCARHVKRAEHACPFCQTSLVADEGASDAFDEQPPRMSRSAMLLAGAAMVAGCNLTHSADIYGSPPAPRAEQDASAPVAAIYGGPPPVLVVPQADASPTPVAPIYGGSPPVLPVPPTTADASAPPVAIYGGPPPRPHRDHHAQPTPPQPHVIPAYGGPPPRRDPSF